MRHIIIRSILAVIWAAGAAVSGASGNLATGMFSVVLCGLCLTSAYSMWKKEKRK